MTLLHLHPRASPPISCHSLPISLCFFLLLCFFFFFCNSSSAPLHHSVPLRSALVLQTKRERERQRAVTWGCFCSCGEFLSYYVSAVGTVCPAGPLLPGHSLLRFFFFPSFFYLPDLLLAQSNSTLWLSVSKSSSFKKKKKKQKEKNRRRKKTGHVKSVWLLGFLHTSDLRSFSWVAVDFPSCAFGVTFAGFRRSSRVALENQLLLQWGGGGKRGLWHGNMSSDNCTSILFDGRHTAYMGQSHKLLFIIGVRSLFNETWTHRRHWHGGNINGATPFLIPCDYDFFLPFTPALLIPLSAPSRLSCL